MRTRSYSDLIRLDSIEERFDYLKLEGTPGRPTFGFDRYLNQRFYSSREWTQLRNHVIARDRGLDLGVEGYEIYNKIYIHHMNPMSVDDLKEFNEDILDPEYLITTCLRTHNAIHYGDKRQLPRQLVVRSAGDTKLW